MDRHQGAHVRPEGLGVRHMQTFLLFLAMLLAFCMRVNMSMAIVDMTNEKHEEGYIILQVPAGELARRLGGKIPMTIAISINSVVSLLMPAAAKFGGWQLVCSCRVFQGLTQGLVYPSMHHLVSQWIPLQETGLLSTIIYAGGQLGIAFQLVASGFIASAWGWQAIFYTNAALGLAWSAAYFALGAESPESCAAISREELRYIQTSLGREDHQKRQPTPWSNILTCLPLWAAVIAHCGQNWGFFTLMTEMPTYMANVLGVNLKNNGALSSLPYLAMYLLSFPMGAMTDLTIRRGWLSVTNTRRLFNTIGLWGPAIALIGLTYAPEGDTLAAVAMLTLSVGVNAGQYAGYLLVIIDLAPNFSGSMMGISNFFANIISIIAPLVCGFIVLDEADPAEWRKIFILASSVYFFTNLFFLIFTTSTRQPWNERKQETDIEMKPAA